VERILSADDPRIEDFRNIREAELARSRGIFIAEGTEVVRTMIARSRHPARAVLLAERHWENMREILARAETGGAKIYVASQEVLSTIAGFDLHRGCLASGSRNMIWSADSLLSSLPESATVLVLEGLSNHDNVGSLFRSAAAFGASAVFLDPQCADPLYRKSIRVSMGTALTVPFARFDTPLQALDDLAARGFELWALTPGENAEDLRALASGTGGKKRALMLGTEGTGLGKEALARAHRRVKIVIDREVDSLNVAVAGAIALFALVPPAAK
jgi:tRNA G18 (ribose-2'-O)-methylase SpoU